uniref:Alginate lyase domain-containing protein n=1 Tax=Mycena chlorophos TaxID=658473 RepID=A0ABQ0M9H1_MYCCL|nr:predicted protein [Mycena chlorophos]
MILIDLAFIAVSLPLVHAANIDWINVNYACKQTRSTAIATRDAQAAICSSARSTANQGPWSVTNNTQGVLPPSKDPRDYMSWAPYHWPQCNWCPAHDSRALTQRGMKRQRRRDQDWEDDDQQAPFSPTPTTQPEAAAASKGKSASTCRPSPTKPMPPSATWTTCDYQVQDGRVNPDVRTLIGPPSIVGVAASVILNALCFALHGDSACSQNAARFIEIFFLSTATAMNPNVLYGQGVRGPNGQPGTFTGPLDIRGLVSVVNAIQILKSAKSPDWTAARDKAMNKWLVTYVQWLQTSPIGKSVADKANNHVTFYTAQLAAAQIGTGDLAGAMSTVRWYFSNKFPDQIAKSGEQPFEAVRTRPFHYRCFHLEALITVGKIADALGMNFWNATSNYGATIQKAVDFAMRLDAKNEDPTELIPHVSAIMAVYGDPQGRYSAYLKKMNSSYQAQPFSFWNQPEAFTQAPSSSQRTRKSRDSAPPDGSSSFASDIICDPPFVDVIGACAYELEYRYYVTCPTLEPFYEMADPDADVDVILMEGYQLEETEIWIFEHVNLHNLTATFMDQDSFRKLLGSQSGASGQRSRGSLLPSKSSTSKSVAASEPAFKPRKLKKAGDAGDKEKEKDKEKYRNRAAERRAGEGNDYAQVEAILEGLQKREGGVTDEERGMLGGDGEHTILVKGLDMALLAQNKARAAASMGVVDDETLERAFQDAGEAATPAAVGKKRTRDDIIRELKAGKKQPQEQQPVVDEAMDAAKQQGKFKPIGFKPIGGGTEGKKKKKGKGGDGERKKKKRKIEDATQVEASKPAATAAPIPPPEDEEPDEDLDIFAGAAEYQGLDDDDEDDNEAEPAPSRPEPETRPRNWFDDDEEEDEQAPVEPIAKPLPRSVPSPPPREMDEDEEEQPMRLVPLASSAMPSIRDFLSMGDESGGKKKRKGKKKKKADKGSEDEE